MIVRVLSGPRILRGNGRKSWTNGPMRPKGVSAGGGCAPFHAKHRNLSSSSVFSPCGIVIRIRNPIELGRSHAVGGAMREEGSPTPVIDDIIGGLVPDFLREKN